MARTQQKRQDRRPHDLAVEGLEIVHSQTIVDAEQAGLFLFK